MQIDTDHLHYWMEAIRQSPDPKRTLDAFWKGQITSKEWLIQSLKPFVQHKSKIDIYCGWVGTLASMLFQSDLPIESIRSIDSDPWCESIATMMNKGEEIEGRFKALAADMCDVRSYADIIINTSCEHITQEKYDEWLSGIPKKGSLVVLQSNNYNIPEHVRWHSTLEDFKKESHLVVLFEGSFTAQLYTRYMLIGYPNV